MPTNGVVVRAEGVFMSCKQSAKYNFILIDNNGNLLDCLEVTKRQSRWLYEEHENINYSNSHDKKI